MAISQAKSKKSESGSRYKRFRKKRVHETGSLPTLTKLEAKRVSVSRGRGGVMKTRLLSHNMANLFDPKTKKYLQTRIVNISENPSNRHFARRNILTKGAVIETEKGKAKITNRPGQEGHINAVLV